MMPRTKSLGAFGSPPAQFRVSCPLNMYRHDLPPFWKLFHSLPFPTVPKFRSQAIMEKGDHHQSSDPEIASEKPDTYITEDTKTGAVIRHVNFTKAEEDAVIRKLDWHLMPLIFVLYSLSVLDRSNLGNARISGLEDDIDLDGNRYSWLGTVFYIACE